MESLFFKLEETLKEQNSILQELLQAARGHNQALQNSDHQQILHWVKEQEILAKQLLRLDATREELLVGAAAHIGPHVQTPLTLSQLKEYLPDGTMATSLKNLTAELKQKLTELALLNQRNEVLAKNGLDFIAQLQGIFQPRGGTTYQNKGQVTEQQPGKVNSLLNKTI